MHTQRNAHTSGDCIRTQSLTSQFDSVDMCNKMNMTMATHILLCALSTLLLLHGDVAAADDSGLEDTISARRLRNHRIRSHDEQSQGQGAFTITRDDYGNKVEVAASRLRGHVADTSPQTLPPLRPQQTKIVNGDSVQHGNGGYPFQVQIGGWICGGSLIAPDVVLTAAHCIIGGSPSLVSIWDGSRGRMTPRTVQSAVMHPSYKSNRLSDDIALIKLSEPALAVNADWDLVDNFDWGDHPPIIRLQRYQTPSGCTSLSQDQAEDITTMTVIGHGTVAEGGKMSGKLLEADVHYVLNSVCQKQYKNEHITDDMICASDTQEEQDACSGDSGGPLFTRLPADGGHDLFTLVGTVSWGYGCAMKEYPGVYSRVAANTDWIDEKVCDLSAKSCTADGKIRDYALESLTGETSVSRRTKKNVSTANAKAALYGEKLQEEICELLGGSVDEETLPPAPAPSSTSRPTISSTPPRAPIISPTMPPTPAPSSSSPPPPSSKRPTSPPSGGGVGGSAKKYTTPSINKARDHAKGVMFQVSAKSNISITGLDIMGKDAKKSDVWVYYQNGSYDKFDALDKGEWVEVFKGKVMLDPDELVNIELDKDMMIDAGGTAS
eukprot:scaffold17811_cov138-Skeletonema_dohrnii-CCMP3373.AAC.1